jgi:hypothetical protein
VALSVSFPPNTRKRHRVRAASNLIELLTELSAAQQVLLHSLGVTFVFHLSREESGGALYSKRQIELNFKEFCQFTHRNKRPTANQRWALSTLKEEVIHFLDDHVGFTSSGAWRTAARKDLSVNNTLRDEIGAAQRRFDSSDVWEKLSPHEYAQDQTILERIVRFVSGRYEAFEELLPNLLLARDYLLATQCPSAEVEQRMRAAFPESYDLALKFCRILEHRSTSLLEQSNLATTLRSMHAEWRQSFASTHLPDST